MQRESGIDVPIVRSFSGVKQARATATAYFLRLPNWISRSFIFAPFLSSLFAAPET